jgi:TonB family protein
MMRVSHRPIRIAAALLALAVPASAQNSLPEAQALYANAQYEEALTALNRMRAEGLAVRDVPPVEQYRALCLLALGRAGEAEEAIAAVITAMPSYAPPDRDVSPRVRSAFQDVRRRVIPLVMQQNYGSAKAAFERQDYAAARDGFAQVMAVLADPALADLVGQPPLADLSLLAKGFHDLSMTSLATVASAAGGPGAPSEGGLESGVPAESAATTAKPAAGERTANRTAPGAPAKGTAAGNRSAPVPATRTASANRTASDAPSASGAPVFSASDAQVVPPAIIRQALPPYPRKPIMPQQGIVEVVIDEHGLVESAAMRQSVDAVYDALALAAARTWQYRPATKDGAPVKFRKGIQVRIQP